MSLERKRALILSREDEKVLEINLLKNYSNHLLSWLLEFQNFFLPSDPNELCDRLKLLVQEKQAGKESDLINEGIVVIAGKLLEYKCISTKHHKLLLIKCLN